VDLALDALTDLTLPSKIARGSPRRDRKAAQKGTSHMSANVLELNEGSFESTVLKSAKPVLVDFWAVWCGPCRQVAPIVESLASKWGDKVTVAKLNVDDVPSVAERYGIMSIPTLMLFKGGQIVERVVGVSPQASLEKKFEPHLN
jgi:thioredoxin 1